ncbi:MAG: polysaccharide biosynthesis tyrosine autokinase [Elusimicrobiaceae bacterium]|nr:polysaccharide biosynthesis tyrosine autokinase [Elusimicrobiaceae bacterium]
MTEQENLQEIDFLYYGETLLRRRWILLSCWAAVVLLVLLVTVRTRPVYQASSLIVIEREKNSGATIQSGPMVERDNLDYYQTQYKLLQSRTLLTKVYDALKLGQYEDFAEPNGIEKLYRAITISPVQKSRLVYIRASSHEPKLAASISNTLSNTYIQGNMSNQLFMSQDVLKALQEQEGTKSSSELFDSLPAVVNNPLIQELKKERANRQSEIASLSGRYTKAHPTVVSLQANLDSISRQIEQEIKRIITSLKIDLSGQLLSNNIRMIDPAIVPLKPSKPKKLLNLVIGVITGFIFGVLVVFIVEAIDQTIRTQDDVETKLKIPFLTLLPIDEAHKSTQTKTPAYHTLLAKDQSLTSEAVRNLRTMIDFAEVTEPNKSFLVTSSMQGEGKSYVCANIAFSIAQAGEKVLIIDGDLRRSNIHKLFRISNAKGVSDFLARGRDALELRELVQKSELENLDILPCGPRPPNPAELLNTPRVSALIDWAMCNYDRVIIDCPPVFPISDIMLWGKYIGRCIFIVRHGETRVKLIQNALGQLEKTGVKMLGAVVNMSKLGGLSYSYYGSYYKYKYNYNYQADSDSSDKKEET